MRWINRPRFFSHLIKILSTWKPDPSSDLTPVLTPVPQELLYELDRIGLKVSVFVDSPLGLEITRIYSDLEAFWDEDGKAFKAKGAHPFDFKGLYAVDKYQDHKKLLNITGPAVIIAGSGMCTGGRIVDHLQHGLNDPANDIFFVGYQAKGTPDRNLD